MLVGISSKQTIPSSFEKNDERHGKFTQSRIGSRRPSERTRTHEKRKAKRHDGKVKFGEKIIGARRRRGKNENDVFGFGSDSIEARSRNAEERIAKSRGRIAGSVLGSPGGSTALASINSRNRKQRIHKKTFGRGEKTSAGQRSGTSPSLSLVCLIKGKREGEFIYFLKFLVRQIEEEEVEFGRSFRFDSW